MISLPIIDPLSAGIVVGGTCLATVMRCGGLNTRFAIHAVARLFSPSFRADRARAELAPQVQKIQQDGVLRAEAHVYGDEEFGAVTDALIGSRSTRALHATHVAHKRRRVEQSRHAVSTLETAAELSSVFGLAGTLISLSQLPVNPGVVGDFSGAISMAVLTTLYGLLLGNLVFGPLAQMVARRAADEERERETVLEWLEHQVTDALPSVATGIQGVQR